MQPALFVGGFEVVLEESLVHLIGIAAPTRDRTKERQAVAHFVMSNETFRKLLSDGRQKLHRDAN